MIQTLHISLLGDFSLVADETAISAIMLPRVQSLLAYLLLHRNVPQNRSHLAFLLWPDSTEAQAHTNLRQLLYHLRQALPDANQLIRADKQSLQWLPAHADVHFTLDIQELEQSLAQAEQEQNTHIRRQALEQVLRLYQGDLLPGCYEEWILPERDRLRELFLKAAEYLLALVEQEQDYSAAISVAQRLLRADPLDEATYRHLMRLYALRGEPAAALRTYHACAQRLEHELGTEPSAMTQAIYASLKQTAEAGISPETRTETVSIQPSETPLQGRKTEWQQFQQAWNKATGGKTGHSQMVLLSGEAGIGKTRLAKECVEWVSRRGITTARARCYATLEHLAYGPITAWLRSDPFQATFSTLDPTALIEISRLMPEVLASRPNLSPPVAMTEGWQRQFFFAALARVILSVRQPLLLWIDDLHWCDQETLEWIQYLFHFAPEACLLVIGTVRAEETSPEHPLMTLLGDLQHDGLVTEIPLGPLTLNETASLVEHMLGSQIDPDRRERFYQETEGNPFLSLR